MRPTRALGASAALWLALFFHACAATNKSNIRRFPDNFKFGVSTASYQIEGAWDEDGKSPSIWDHLTHEDPCIIKDCLNGDVAADSYHQYERDVEIMRELGIDHYRFSLSWTRILPSGFANNINEPGVQYYNNLIDELLKYNIQPMVTLYHWDLPQSLQDLGGFANPLFVDWFSDFARISYELFGDRVKIWTTFNEPKQICYFGYGEIRGSPMVNIKGIGEYYCAKHLLLAHAKAWHIYNDEFRATQNGENGIAVNAEWFEPMTDSKQDVQAADDVRQFEWGHYFHPIYSDTGDFPQVMKDRIAANSAAQGFPRSRLPKFTEEEVDYIKGTADYLAVNSYSTKFVYRNESVVGLYEEPSFMHDINAVLYASPDFPQSAVATFQVIPWGFYKVLDYIKNNYNNPKVYVTENGFSTQLQGLEDEDRVYFYRHYLDALLDAVEDGCNVQKYTAWTLLDNFEWMSGYTVRFGLYEVDFEDPARTRTARKSAHVYKEIIRSRVIDFDYEPQSMAITID